MRGDADGGQKPAFHMPRIRPTAIRTEPDPWPRVAAVELSARPLHHACHLWTCQCLCIARFRATYVRGAWPVV
jgi:hypothetical protein